MVKQKGDSAVVGGMIVTMLTLVVIVTAVFSYASWQSQLEHTYEIDLVMHKYLVELETADFSDQAAIDYIYSNIEAELLQHHVTGIDFSGSTQTVMESGSRIVLHVKGTLTIPYVSLPVDGGLASAQVVNRSIALDITKSGTAMY